MLGETGNAIKPWIGRNETQLTLIGHRATMNAASSG